MIKTNKQNKKGQAMVEFALVFPLLLMLMLGIMEFGRIMFAYSATIAASREGARYGSANREVDVGIPQYKDCEGIREATKRIGFFAGINDSNIQIQYSDGNTIYDTSCPPSEKVNLGDRIVVTSDTTISPLVPLLNIPPIPITSSSSRTIIKQVQVGEGSASNNPGTTGDPVVFFKTTTQYVYETDGTIPVEVLLSETISDPVTVPFSVSGGAVEGGAEEGDDYTITPSDPKSITIPAGSQQGTIEVTLNNDGEREGNETLVIGLEDPENAIKGSQDTHSITIQDPPTVEFTTTSSTASEDTSTVSLTVELSKPSSREVTVPFSDSEPATGTATWGSSNDYTYSPSSPLTFSAGTTSRSINIYPNDDALDEPDGETVIMTLGTPTNAILGTDKTHTLSLNDNDDPPSVSFITSTEVISEENPTSDEPATFTTTVVLSHISGKDITVPFSITPISDGATEDDYSNVQPSSQQLSFPAGTRTASISFDIDEGDGLEEPEDFELALGTPTNATLGSPSTLTVTIVENVGEPDISFLNINQESSEGEGLVTIPVVMSNAYYYDISISYTNAGSATAGNDSTISPSSSLTIPVGSTVGEIEVQLQDDATDEPLEDLVISLTGAVDSNGSNVGSIVEPDQHTVSIYDNDDPPEVNFHSSDQTVGELDGTASVQIDVSTPSAKEITASLGLSGTATQDSDYSVTSQSVTISPYTDSGTYTIDILDDSHYDDGETIIVSLLESSNPEPTYRLGTLTEHTITIADDELSPCDVGTYRLSVGASSLNWEMVNDGQELTFTGGSITWPEDPDNTDKPQLKSITFGGVSLLSANVKPPSYSFTASETFPSVSTRSLVFEFNGALASGEHSMVANFENPSTGEACSLTKTYNQP